VRQLEGVEVEGELVPQIEEVLHEVHVLVVGVGDEVEQRWSHQGLEVRGPGHHLAVAGDPELAQELRAAVAQDDPGAELEEEAGVAVDEQVSVAGLVDLEDEAAGIVQPGDGLVPLPYFPVQAGLAHPLGRPAPLLELAPGQLQLAHLDRLAAPALGGGDVRLGGLLAEDRPEQV
jgi:hypothetical protein